MPFLSTLLRVRSSRKNDAKSLLEGASRINRSHYTRKDISSIEMNRPGAGTLPVAESRLPTELLLLIFDYTSVEDILRCRTVSFKQ